MVIIVISELWRKIESIPPWLNMQCDCLYGFLGGGADRFGIAGAVVCAVPHFDVPLIARFVIIRIRLHPLAMKATGRS